MAKNTTYQEKVLDTLRENYLSIALGFLVFLIAVTLIFRSTNRSMISDQAAQNGQANMMEKGGKAYMVKRGDSVSSIARDQLGSMDYADEIIAENNLSNANQIEVGQELKLPKVSVENTEAEAMEEDKGENMDKTMTPTVAPTQAMMKKDESGAAMTGKVTITGSTYTVKKGDFLYDIALRAYGDGNMYNKLIEANKSKLRNPDRLVEGMVLTIPR